MERGKKQPAKKRRTKTQRTKKHRPKATSRTRRAVAAGRSSKRHVRIYQFAFGDASDDAVGGHVAVAAHSAEMALERAREILFGGAWGVGLDSVIEQFGRKEHADEGLSDYFKPGNLRLADIEDDYDPGSDDE
jgi:hypothetical protein